MYIFEPIMQLATFQNFQNNINGVIGLIDCKQFHNIRMVKFPHEGNLIDERLFALLPWVLSLFRECLDGN